VQAGYTQVVSSTAYSALTGYGWSSTAGLDSRDRGAPDSLRRDFVFSSTEHTFNVDLANGDYLVTVIIGDQGFIHDQINVYAEGTLVINHLTVVGGSFREVSFRVTVTDERLNLRILDDGGSDGNWVLDALTVEVASPLPTEASFDFGTSGSSVQAGYTQVVSSTAYSALTGYGWSSTVGLDSRDRGSPDSLRCDFVFSSTEHTFNVDLANGDTYLVTVVIGDQSFMHDKIDVYAEGKLVINDLTALPGSFQEVTFAVIVTDQQLNLRFVDDGGADANWVISALTVRS
jgi:fibronectin type 3 domain-containing protein